MAGLITDAPGGELTLGRGTDAFETIRGGTSYWTEGQNIVGIGNPGWAVNRYYRAFDGFVVTNGGTAPGANNLRFYKGFVPIDVTIDRIGLRVVATQASQNAQVAIYNITSGLPGTLVVNSGNLSTGSAAFVESTISTTLYAGWYYFASACDHGTPTFSTGTLGGGIQAAVTGATTGGNVLASSNVVGLSYAGTAGTWPDMTSLHGSLTEVVATSMPLVAFRVASLF